MVDALRAGAGFDVVTAVAMSLAQSGRLAEATEVVDAATRELDPAAAGGALHACAALVHASHGRVREARACAESVFGDDRASYLDRAFAGMATGLAAARAGDPAASAEGFRSALTAVDATGDQLTQAIVTLAQARSMEGPAGADRAGPGVETALNRLRELGTDAHGWVRLFGLALGDETA